jgi:uncharacterized membrane-anchored protein
VTTASGLAKAGGVVAAAAILLSAGFLVVWVLFALIVVATEPSNVNAWLFLVGAIALMSGLAWGSSWLQRQSVQIGWPVWVLLLGGAVAGFVFYAWLVISSLGGD